MDNHKSRRTEIQKRSERWPLELQQQFQALQDEYRQGKDGQAPMSQLAAFTAAWDDVRASAEEFEAENPEADTEVEKLARQSGSADFDRDFQWAYQNLGNPKAKEKDAPSTSAWFLLEYGREAKAKFLEVTLRYNTQKNKPDAEKQKFVEDQRKVMSILDKFAADDCSKCPSCGANLL